MLGASQSGFIGAPASQLCHLVFQRMEKSAATKSGTLARRADPEDIVVLHAAASNHLMGVASTDQIRSLQRRDPDSVWVFERKRKLKGGIGLLMLNQAGANALLEGFLDRSAPQSAFLAAADDKPAAIYLWALLAQGTAILGLLDLNRQCQTGRLSGVDLLATSRTLGGSRAMRLFGFAPAAANPNFGIMRRKELV